MPIEYLVNLGVAQLYFDRDRQRCAPPGCDGACPIHFVRVDARGALLHDAWDHGLAAFTRDERDGARLYRKAGD